MTNKYEKLVVLMGGQLTPNMYAISQFAPSEIISVHTSHPLSKDADAHLRDLFPDGRVHSHHLKDEYSIDQVTKCLSAVLQEHRLSSENGAILATSGTKTMAVGAYEAGKSVGVPVFYFEKSFYFMTPDRDPLPLTYAPTLAELVAWQVRGHSLEASARKPLMPPETMRKLLTHQGGFLLEDLKFALSIGKTEPVTIGVNKDQRGVVATVLDRLGIPFDRKSAQIKVSPPLVSSSAARWIGGDWLEECAMLALEQTGKVREICIGAEIKDRSGNLVTDLDVAAIYKEDLVWISCKSGSSRKHAGPEIENHLNEIASRKTRLGGLRTRAFLVVSSKILLKQSILELAQFKGVRVIRRGELPHMTQILAEELNRPISLR